MVGEKRMSMYDSFAVEESELKYEVERWEQSGFEKGQVYTRPEVVDFMLRGLGLHQTDVQKVRILEPSCGEGEFVVGIVELLMSGFKERPSIDKLKERLLAIDIVDSSVDIAKDKVKSILERNGYSKCEISELLNCWFMVTDFLLEGLERSFTHVVGNPPYIRVENIPKRLLSEYRKRYKSMTDRADLYVPFFEKSLSLLVDDGRLSFICTDRWTKNVYGRSLRKLIGDKYSLEAFIDLYGVDAFEQQVMTYPAITQIINAKDKGTVLAHWGGVNADDIYKSISGEYNKIVLRKGIVDGSKPWLLSSPEVVELIRKLERQLPTLEGAGCKVFIGAATGSNKVYIVDRENVDIEDSRLLPVVTANEIKTGEIKWRGKYLINTYDENGVVSLNDYPKLAAYLTLHKAELSKRHVAQNDLLRWYKTIDRVYASRCKAPKLLIPDIGNDSIVVFDDGVYHPNNSIYYICSDSWNLHALRVVLLSSITKLFISTYSTKIAHGYMRFQSQHLRKLRIPDWMSVDENLKSRLIEAGLSNNVKEFDNLVCELYKLNCEEKATLGV